MSDVPCNGCTLCCRGEAVVLMPEAGDRIEDYEHEEIAPFEGRRIFIVKQKENRECVYLGPGGCTIYDKRPQICRAFDCRDLVLKLNRAQRRRALALGTMDAAVLERGRELIRAAR